jgi:hypothetical protein
MRSDQLVSIPPPNGHKRKTFLKFSYQISWTRVFTNAYFQHLSRRILSAVSCESVGYILHYVLLAVHGGGEDITFGKFKDYKCMPWHVPNNFRIQFNTLAISYLMYTNYTHTNWPAWEEFLRSLRHSYINTAIFEVKLGICDCK